MIDPSDTTDARLRHGRNHMTGGGAALWERDPAAMLIEKEAIAGIDPEGETARQRERQALRDEIFNTLLGYLLADGPEPWHVSARSRAFLCGVLDFHPDRTATLAIYQSYQRLIHCPDDDFWKTAQEVSQALKPYATEFRAILADLRGTAPLSTWFAALNEEHDFATVHDTLRFLALLLFSQGHRPRNITATAYCLAKIFQPWLLGSMSLHTIAILSGDSGRATPMERCKRVYTHLAEEAGARATRFHHQKTASTAEKCRAAQLGNSNRNKNIRSRKRK